MKLTEYLARKALEIIGKRLVAAWGTACEATKKNVAHLYCRLLMSLLMEPQKLISIH